MLQVFRPPHLLSSPLGQYLSNDVGKDLSLLLTKFPKDWSVYVMGGVLRNLLLEELRGLPMRTADVDLVINGASSSTELRDRLKYYRIHQNQFGGVKCKVNPTGVIFDVWRIEDHVGMSSIHEPCTIEQLLRHNLLDVDAILLDLQTEELYDYGCLAAIHRRRIDLLGKEGISGNFAAAQAAHIILIALKTGFDLSSNALQLVRKICETAERKSSVLRIVNRKMPDADSVMEPFLNELLKEGLWPAMTP